MLDTDFLLEKWRFGILILQRIKTDTMVFMRAVDF